MLVGKVGSKGELFPPKEIRDQLGFKEGQKIKYYVSNGRLIVEKLYSVEEILSQPAKVEISVDEIKKHRKELSHNLEQ